MALGVSFVPLGLGFLISVLAKTTPILRKATLLLAVEGLWKPLRHDRAWVLDAKQTWVQVLVVPSPLDQKLFSLLSLNLVICKFGMIVPTSQE